VFQYGLEKGESVTRLTLLLAALVAMALPAVAQAPPAPRHVSQAPPAEQVPAGEAAVYEKMAREFLANFIAGRFDAAEKDFSGSLKSVATVPTLKKMKEQLESQGGAFRYISAIRQTEEDSFPVVELMAEYEKSAVAVRVVFDEDWVGAVFFNPLVAERIDPKLEEVARDLLAGLVEGRFEAAEKFFDPGMRGQLPPQKLAELARSVNETFGRFLSVTSVRQKTGPALRTIDLVAAYEKSPVRVSVIFDARGGVSGLTIAPAAR
jgi:hypothetical protein